MIQKYELSADPRGLIFEAYKIADITPEECRSIFLDWALEMADDNLIAKLDQLLDAYQAANSTHPMTVILTQAKAHPPTRKRRGGRKARLNG